MFEVELDPMRILKDDKLKRVQEWVRRTMHVPPILAEKRRHPRREANESATIVRFDRTAMLIESEKVFQLEVRDRSVGGIGALSDDQLEGDLFFVEFADSEVVYLVRLAWAEQDENNQKFQYGFQILDQQVLDELL